MNKIKEVILVGILIICFIYLFGVAVSAEEYYKSGCYAEYLEVYDFQELPTNITVIGVYNKTKFHDVIDGLISTNESFFYVNRDGTDFNKLKENKNYYIVICPVEIQKINYSDEKVRLIVKDNGANKFIYRKII